MGLLSPIGAAIHGLLGSGSPAAMMPPAHAQYGSPDVPTQGYFHPVRDSILSFLGGGARAADQVLQQHDMMRYNMAVLAAQEREAALQRQTLGSPFIGQAQPPQLDAHAGFGPPTEIPGQAAPSPPTSRSYAPVAAKALMDPRANPELVKTFMELAKANDPQFQQVNGWSTDGLDPNSYGKFFPKLSENMVPQADAHGNVVGAAAIQGAPQAVATLAAAQAGGQKAGELPYVGPAAQAQAAGTAQGQLPYAQRLAAAQASGTAAGQAPYDLVDVPMPDGSTIKLPKAAYLAQGGGMAPGGLGHSQSPADATYAGDIAKSSADTYKGVQTAGQNAMSKIAKLRQLDQLLTGFDGNKLSATGIEIARAGAPLFGISDKMSNAEAAQALSNQMALELRNPASGAGMPGSLSNADRDFLMNSVPGLTQSAPGRHKLVQLQVSVAQRESDVAQKARRWQQRFGRIDAADASGKTFQDYLQEWADRNPLFK